MTYSVDPSSYKSIQQMLKNADTEGLSLAFDQLDKHEIVHLLFQLSKSEQQSLLSLMAPEKAAALIEEVPDSHAAEVLEEIEPQQAASIVAELPSDERADLLQQFEDEDVEQILNHMGSEDAAKTKALIEYSPDVAGGLMMTEYLSFPSDMQAKEVIADLTERSADYALYNVQYLYVVSRKGVLSGVVRLRDLVLAKMDISVGELAIAAETVDAETSLDDLSNFFETHELAAVPVVDSKNRLLGVLRQKSVDLAFAERAESDHQKSQGIVSGEELRSLPTLVRSKRRLSWLSVNIGLNLIAASVIAAFESTLSAVIALAVFLPIVSDMSGCSGNQSVAVSMRELTLGIVRPKEILRVWLKEVTVGFINGIVLGLLIAIAAYLWIGNPYLGAVVGLALMLNTMIAVSIGGTVPLILKRFDVDPAIASGPVLTTITDMCGFFLVLGLATLALPLLV